MDREPVIRGAREDDRETIAAIYNEGIAEGRSTFESEPRSAADIGGWLGSPGHPVLIVVSDGSIAGWARLAPYSPRPCYARVAEASVYVRAAARGHGLGSALAAAQRERATQLGLEKVIGKLFAETTPSRRLAARHGFREVGLHLRHGRVRGEWRDVVLAELLLGMAAEGLRL